MNRKVASSPGVLAALAILGATALVTLSAARFAKPLWAIEDKTLHLMLLIGAGYLFMIAALLLGERLGRRASFVQVALVGAVAAVPLLAAAIFYHPQFSRTPLLVAPVLGVVLAWVSVCITAYPWVRVGFVALLAALGIALQVARSQGAFEHESAPSRVTTHVSTSLYGLTATAYRNYIPRPFTNQGGISLFADGYLLATGDGDIYVYRRSKDHKSLSVEPIPAAKVPINSAEFVAAATGSPIILNWFRVADILAQESGETFRLFVTHHYYKTEEKCWVLRVSTMEGRYDAFNSQATNLEWKTLFETTPCMPLATKDLPMRFEGLFDGGRMVLLNDHEMLISIGDHGMEGFGYAFAAAQEPTASYGKTVLLDLRDNSSSTFTMGHRNPEGLHLAPDGTIWETEHGPQGGDELNRLQRGGNYGWPLVTYGVEYGTHAWPLSSDLGSHEGYVQPYASWFPSIGPSNVIEVTSPLFSAWRGDLLVSSLAANSLFRMRVRENRIVHTEQINLGERIRDILEGHDGELVLWTDSETMIFLEPSTEDSTSGEALYSPCAACHVAANPQASTIGPPLQGVAGRRIASSPGFEYSAGLTALEGTWTRERLDAFIENPARYAPGTSMQFPGLPDPDSRGKLLDYIFAPGSRLDRAPATPEVD